MSSKSHSELYRKSMKHLDFGYGLYHPCRYEELRPGMIGFLDEYRKWHPIVDLTDAAAVKAAGYTELQYQVRKKPETVPFSPLNSSDVKRRDISLDGSVDAATLGLPVDIGGVVQYSTSAEFGAVTVLDSDVWIEGYDNRTPFKSWLKENSKKLLKEYAELSNFGVIATTMTYASEDVFIQTWQDNSHAVTLGFKTGAVGLGNVDVSTSWYRASNSGQWRQFQGEKHVFFFTGIKINYWPIVGAVSQLESGWRGGEDKFAVDVDDERFGAASEEFGEDWSELKRRKKKAGRS